MSILRSRTSILCFGFILVIRPCCKHADAQSAEKFILNCEKPLDDQIRHFPPTSPAIKLQAVLNYNEKPLWPLQWFMTEEQFTVDNNLYSPSMKIAEMHYKGIKGDGVGVVIIGNTSVNCQHVAIQSRCHATDSPTSLSMYPRKSLVGLCIKKYKLPLSSKVASGIAGIIGMSDDGKTGGVGIAPKSHIGSVVIQPSSRYGSPEYCAARISARNTFPPAELFVHAWILPYVDYQKSILHALNHLSLLNFKDPRTVLRPHVMTCTKNGILANSCQCNEYANADSMFLFGGVEYSGYLPPTFETCASLFGVVYSDSVGNKLYNKIVTIASVSPNSFHCAENFYFDTDPAVGIAGGIIALIIDSFKRKFQRSPSVSDLAFLLAFSLSSETLQDTNILWFSNGIRLMYSLQAGFGLPNMLKVESLLRIWTPMDFPIIYEVTRSTREIEFRCGHDKRRRTLTYYGNLVCNFHFLSNAQTRMHIQLVTVQLSAKLVNRGALSVYLISPAGTVSCILEGRPYDTDKRKYNKLLLRSNHFIGEQLGGRWSIRFYTYQENSKPLHSEEILPTENKDKHPVDASKPLHPNDDDITFLVPPSSSSDSESDVSCEDTGWPNYQQRGKRSGDGKAAVLKGDSDSESDVSCEVENSPNYLQRGKCSGDGKAAVLEGGKKIGPKNVRFQEDMPSGKNLADSSPQSSVSASSSQPAYSQNLSGGGHQTSSTIDPQGTEVQFPNNSPKNTGTNLEPLVLQPIYEQGQTTSESVSRADAKHEQVADISPQIKAASSNLAGNSVPTPSSSLESNAALPTASVASNSEKISSPVNSKPTPPLKPPTLTSSLHNGGKPIPRTKKREPNAVNLSDIKFRFVLHERLPLKLNLEPRVKENVETEKDLELLKAWVDFRHYLFAKLDPEKKQYFSDESKNPYTIFNKHVKNLIKLQKNNKIDSVFNVPLAHLNAILGITDVNESAHPVDNVQEKASPKSSVPQVKGVWKQMDR